MDKSAICMQCGVKFTITSNEQEKLQSRGFSLPKRCPECRKHKDRGTRENNDEWDNKRKRKQSRRRKEFFEDGI